MQPGKSVMVDIHQVTPARKTKLLIRCTPETTQLGVLLVAATQGEVSGQLLSEMGKQC